MRNIACAALALVALCGCFKVKDELVIEPDGSGSVRMEVRTSLPSEMLGAMGMGGGKQSVLYPPVTEAEARKFFPAAQFTLTAKQQRNPGGESVLAVDASFKDVNALLASSYGRAHSLTIIRTNGALRLRGITGVEGAARVAEVKDDSGMFGAFGGAADPDLEKKKQDMRVEFRVSLPNPLTAAADASRDGKSAVWVFERSKFKDSTEFAHKLGAVLEASCPDQGVQFTPTNLLRLDSLTFGEVPEDAVQQAQGVDSAKVLAAAKFVPCALFVTRSLDLTGDNMGRHENAANFVGAIVLPADLAPDRWGEPKLIEAVDARGTNLKPPPNRSFASRSYEYVNQFGGQEEDENDDGTEGEEGESQKKTAKPSGEKRRIVTLTFQPPDWKVNEIARIKGSVTLQYYSGAQVLKLSNAIPAKWIVDASNERNFASGGDAGAKVISNPKLAARSLKLTVPMAMSQQGGTMLNLSLEGEKSGLTEAQVFDANGRPWPTFLNSEGSGGDEARSYNIMVAGKPQPPLSLALMVTGSGASVELPISAEKMPLRKD